MAPPSLESAYLVRRAPLQPARVPVAYAHRYAYRDIGQPPLVPQPHHLALARAQPPNALPYERVLARQPLQPRAHPPGLGRIGCRSALQRAAQLLRRPAVASRAHLLRAPERLQRLRRPVAHLV